MVYKPRPFRWGFSVTNRLSVYIPVHYRLRHWLGNSREEVRRPPKCRNPARPGNTREARRSRPAVCRAPLISAAKGVSILSLFAVHSAIPFLFHSPDSYRHWLTHEDDPETLREVGLMACEHLESLMGLASTERKEWRERPPQIIDLETKDRDDEVEELQQA